MIRKRLLSACLALALCLSLLPVTALAEENAPTTLYVGSTTITTGYWTSSDGGTNWTSPQEEPTGDSYIHYNGQGTLELHNATIQGGSNTVSAPYGAGIYAQGSSNQPVTLTIELIGENTITGTFGIYVNAEMSNESYGTDASLTITGQGSLDVSGSSHGIWVKSGSGNASLNIEKATVTSSTDGEYDAGVYVMSSMHAISSPQLSLKVNGGSLTASGTGNSDGILFHVGQSQATGATTSLTITDHAIVDARNGGISASRISETLPTPTPTGNNSSGIVFDSNTGTVYGSVALQDDLTIGAGETLTIPDGASLTIDNGATLTNEGTVTNNGTLTNNGIINNSGTLPDNIEGTAPPSITTTALADGAENTAYNATLEASGDPTSWTWSAAAGSNTPPGLTLNNDGTITGTPTAAGTYSFTVTATNDYGSDSKEFTLTIDQQGTIHVTSVSLDKANLELTEGGTDTLTATITPNNATNKNVTWESSNTSVATVDANGLVTAVSAGTATITVTTEDGSKTATCEVTVTAATVPVTGVTMNKTSTSLYVGDTETLTATVQPGNASSQTVTWSTSNPSVATVENGVVRATGRGTATITVTTADGNYTATCTVTVSRYSTGGGPTTYAVTAPDAENGTVRVSPSRASRGTTVTITVTPDEGYELESLTVLDSRDNEIALTDKGDGKYTFTMPSGRVTVEASFAEIAPEPLPFGDVDDGDWFADAVRFVYENGMMNGVSETSFAPHAATSRSMIVTILYRLEGEPVVDYAMDFTDVAGDAYYAEAVRWAASEGIVGGYGGGLFGSEDAVTREQLAAILYRYAAYKGYDVSIGEDTNILSYDDFADLSEYAIPAMQWACGAGIVNGTSESTLTPQGEATRAQVAAMLMRFCENIVQ